MAPKNLDARHIQTLLAQQTCLIVDPSPAFSTSLRACLQDLGIPAPQIAACGKFSQAKLLMIERRPTLLITEYKIESSNGFELIELQESMHEQSKRISVITSKTTSTAVLAEAAEGHVDGYLLKPFSVEVFRKYFLEIIRRKTDPSPYLEKLSTGKTLSEKSEFDLAIHEYRDAKKLNSKPALACFYLGETLRKMGKIDEAIAQFREGRMHQPLHYKCIIAEFETLLQNARHDETFELVSLIQSNFPMSPARIVQLFKTISATGHFERLHALFEAYRELDERNLDLTNVAEETFLQAGCESLQHGQIGNAIAFFETGLQISGRSLGFVERVIGELLLKNAANEAEAFLGKASPSDVGSPAFHRLSFRVHQSSMTNEQRLNKGRELIFAGHATPEIFRLVVRSFAEAGKETMAETAISKAVESFPELRAPLYKILADHLPKSQKQAA